MNKRIFFSLLCVALCASYCSNPDKIRNEWKPFKTIDEKGLLGERVNLWRDIRLWFVADSGFLLSGFETRPGIHPWQGEHVGKWLHAATLAYEVTGDEELKKELDRTAERLISTQLSNGYLGTYSEDKRFYTVTDDTRGWDVWTHRYNLYGLLIYEKYHPDQRVVDACEKMGNLLIETFGEGKADITKYGTRQGISSTTLLESMVMLYERTGKKKYLEFAEYMVACSENNRGLRLMDAMLHNESVVYPGDGKAYQLMANLLGYYRLYLCTGKDKYLETVENGWKEIRRKHILVTGGPWTRKMAYNANKECFAMTEDFEPEEVAVENCCTVTWIQLNLHLFELTGQARYADEAEVALFNHLLGAQDDNGKDWCYYTPPNGKSRAFEPAISCCASSGPRALEMFSGHLAGEIQDHLSINSFSPSVLNLPAKYGGGNLRIKGNFPFSPGADIVFITEQAKQFPVEFRIPHGAEIVTAEINGETVLPVNNERGFYQVANEWKPGDLFSIELKYVLDKIIQTGADGKKWVAFSYGPFALAQTTNRDMIQEEPLKNMKANAIDPGKLLNMIPASGSNDRDIVFTVKGTQVELVPYYRTGSVASGPKTYFECLP
jgi:DUF1680 family protein